MSRLDLVEKFFRAEGLQPWHFRSSFSIIFCIRKFNPLFGTPGQAQFIPQDLSLATFRFVLREDREDPPAKAALYDFEEIEGTPSELHITFDADPTTGQVTVSFDEDDIKAKARRGYWYQAILKIPTEKRKVHGEGLIDILPTVDPSAAVDPEV